MTDKYILKDRKPVKANLLEWATWFEVDANRMVARDKVGDVLVSTIFIGLDASRGRNKPPLLFESIVLGGEHELEQIRTATWEEAEEAHRKLVELVKKVI